MSKEWAQGKLESGDFRSLAAAVAAGATNNPLYEHHLDAMKVLGDTLDEGNPQAFQAAGEELEDHPYGDMYLIRLLIKADDAQAVPALKNLLSKPTFSGDFDEPEVRKFVAKFDTETKAAIVGAKQAEEEGLESAREEVRGYNEPQMVQTLQELCDAYIRWEEQPPDARAKKSDDDPDVQRLEPKVRAIGERLDHAGGIAEMRRVFAPFQGVRVNRKLESVWSGIGEWQD